MSSSNSKTVALPAQVALEPPANAPPANDHGARPLEAPPPTELPNGTPVPRPGGKFKLKSWGDIAFSGQHEWPIKKILPRCGTAALYGESEAYKSFVALNMALTTALGRPWAGRRVYGGPVVYVASEAPYGLRKRKTGYTTAWRDLPAEIDFHLISVAPNLGTDDGDRAALIADIEAAHVKPVLVVIDTLIKSIGSADENGVGMVAFANNCGAISHHFGCLVLAVHHVGLGADSKQRMRGHSSFRGGVDAQILCERPEKRDYVTKLTVQKQKEDAKGFCLEARLERVILGYDEDGEAISTLIVSEVVNADAPALKAAEPTKAKKVPASKLLLMDVLRDAIDNKGMQIQPDGASGPEVRAVAETHVRQNYFKRIAEKANVDEDAEKLYDRQDKSFKRAAKAALDNMTLVAADYEGERFFWLPPYP